MNFRLILALLLLVSAPVLGADPPPVPEPSQDAGAAPPPLRDPPQRRETLRSKALAEQIKRLERETEVSWLGAGESEFLALYLADHSGKTFANALILHDNQQHPDWPGLVRSLRHDLAAHGWNTLAIQLPDYLEAPVIPKDAPPPAESEATAPPPEQAMPGAKMPGAKTTAATKPPATEPEPPPPEEPKSVEFPLEQVPDIVDSRTRTAVGLLQQKFKGPTVIVAIGLSAAIAAKKAQTMLIADIAGIVIVDPVEPASLDFKIDLDAMDLRIPVLDIAPEFYPRSNPVLRRNSARRARHDLYEQRIIPGSQQQFPDMERSVENAIRGWGERWFK